MDDAHKRIRDQLADEVEVQEPPQPTPAGEIGKHPGRHEADDTPDGEPLLPGLEGSQVRVGWEHPRGSASRPADDPLDLVARRGRQVDGIICRLAPAQDGHLADDGVRVVEEGIGGLPAQVGRVDDRGVEAIGALDGGLVWHAEDTRGHDELATFQDLSILMTGFHLYGPARPVSHTPHLHHLGIVPDLVRDVELVGVRAEKSMHDISGDVLTLPYAKTIIYRQIGKVVTTPEVIRLQRRVDALLGPYAPECGVCVQDQDFSLGIIL